jgi:hypothetical protein
MLVSAGFGARGAAALDLAMTYGGFYRLDRVLSTNVGNRTAHFITRDDFNQEFNAWKRLNGYT